MVAREAAVFDQLKWWANCNGLTGAPFDSYLTLRGLRTLSVRLRQHQENAVRIAGRLDGHPAVRKVYYPGLESHPGHALAARQQQGFGAMLSFELDGELAQIAAFADAHYRVDKRTQAGRPTTAVTRLSRDHGGAERGPVAAGGLPARWVASPPARGARRCRRGSSWPGARPPPSPPAPPP